jgi:hypothetical protein
MNDKKAKPSFGERVEREKARGIEMAAANSAKLEAALKQREAEAAKAEEPQEVPTRGYPTATRPMAAPAPAVPEAPPPVPSPPSGKR